MNLTADPAFVAAEVAYRFETGRVSHPAVRPARHRRDGVPSWLRRMAHRGSSARHRPARTQRA